MTHNGKPKLIHQTQPSFTPAFCRRRLPGCPRLGAAQGACAAPGESGALRSVLCRVTCYFCLMLAFSAQTRPRDFFWQDFSIRSVWFPLSRSLVCACACFPLLLRQSVGELCGFKGSKLHQTLLKLLPDQYFLNELDVTQQRLRQLLDLSNSKATRLAGDICSRPGCSRLLCPHHEEELLTEVKFFGCKTATCESHSLPT